MHFQTFPVDVESVRQRQLRASAAGGRANRSGQEGAVVPVADREHVDLSGGLTNDQFQEAPAGVNPGDLMIVQGQTTLNDGDPVRPSPAGG